MDYEKMYNEALERAKKFEEKYGGGYAEYIFPELAESEDERIRKLLVWQVYRNIEDETNDLAGSVYDGIKGHDPDLEESIEDWKKCLAWLEKQKENPKSADSIPSDCTSDAKYEDRWHKVEDSLPDNGREVLAKDKLGNTLLARYDGEGWDVSVYDDDDYRCHNGISKWCEIPSEKQKEQKHGWSEEDQKMIECIINVLASFPITFTSNYNGGTSISYGGFKYQKEMDWLKSLRPSWKPSEEQMKALEAATVRYQSTGLESLYEDLKKL